VTASDGSSTAAVNIAWSAVPGATGYRVLRSAAGSEPVQVGAPSATTFADTSARPGIAYSYVVRARTAAGDSAASGADRGWRNVIAPQTLMASDGSSADGVELSWTSAAAGDGFSIYRSSGTGAPALIGSSRMPRFRDTTAEPMTSYSYVVRAKAGPGESAPSNVDRGWRSIAGPATVSATDGTEREFVRVTWAPSTSPAVTGYRVLRQLPGGQLLQLDAVPASAATLNDKTIEPGVIGTYVVRCITARGDSPDGASDTGFRPTDADTSGDDGTGGDGSDGDGRSGHGRSPARPTKISSDGLVPAGGESPGAGTASRGVTPASSAEGDPLRPGTTSDLEDVRTVVRQPSCEELKAHLQSKLPDGRPYPDCGALLAGDEPAACRMAEGDVNLDGRIDDRDLADFLVAWADGDLFHGDLNRDGQVDRADLFVALAINPPQIR
jgi:fibronectin type 3 domain-containing protein